MGGIVANNSSGMVTGVKLNAYHTMDSIRFVLADGSVFDTAACGEHGGSPASSPHSPAG